MSQKSIYIPYLHLFLDLWAYTCIPTSLSISITEVTSLHKYSQEWFSFLSYTNKKRTVIGSLISSQLSLNREGRWGTTDDFAASFLHFPCFPLPSKTWRTPGLSIPRCCLPTSSSVCFVFVLLSLCLARLFWPDLMNGRHDHTTAVCVSLQWSGLRIVRLPAGSWHGLPHW